MDSSAVNQGLREAYMRFWGFLSMTPFSSAFHDSVSSHFGSPKLSYLLTAMIRVCHHFQLSGAWDCLQGEVMGGSHLAWVLFFQGSISAASLSGLVWSEAVLTGVPR